jgi:hypothetical protein
VPAPPSKGDFPIFLVMAAGACFLGDTLTAERHAEIRRELDLIYVSETDSGDAAEALTGVAPGPKERGLGSGGQRRVGYIVRVDLSPPSLGL